MQLKAAASKVWGGITSRTKSWWSGLSSHDRVVAVLVVVVIGTIGYQHFALKRARENVDDLKAQVANMATKQQVDALNKSIGEVDAKVAETKKATDAARADAQTALQKLGKPYKSTGMKSNEIVNAFKSLSAGSGN